MKKRLRVRYDRFGDVLYVILGPTVAIEGDGLPGGVELDYSQDDGSPVGVTVIGYARNAWVQRVSELAGIVSKHLSTQPARVQRALEKINA